MKIYTSYFAKVRELPPSCTAISIAKFKPKWFNGEQCLIVAPTYSMLRFWKNDKEHKYYKEEDYRKDYYEILEKIDPKDLVEWLHVLGNGNDVALCCYEKPGDFCHRHLLAEWLRNAGYECEEFSV